MKRAALVLACLCLPASALSEVASAAPGRIPPRAIFTSNDPTGANIGVSPLDEAIAILTTGTSGDGGPSLVGVVRGANGAINLTQELSRSRGAAYPKDILFSNAGRSFLSWGVQPAFSSTSSGEYTTRAPGGLFDSPVTWADDMCRFYSRVRFVADGRPTVACSSIAPTGPGPHRVITSDADQISGNSFSSGVVVQTPIGSGPASLLIDVGPDGTRAIAWTTLETPSLGGSSNYIVKLAVSPGGTGFRPAETVATASTVTLGYLSLNDLAVLADGRVVVAFTRDNGSSLPALGEFRVRGSGATGTLGPEQSVSSSEIANFEAERDGQGAALMWTERLTALGSELVAKTASVGAAGTRSTPVTLPSGSGNLFAQNLRVGPNGAASIARIEFGAISGLVRPASLGAWVRSAPGGQFAGPFSIGSTSAGQSIRDFNTVVDRHGSVAAVWVEGIDSAGKVFLGGLDAAGPSLTSLATPARLRAGRAGRFSVQAVDPSGVRSVRWDFGDRGSANGAVASHSFRRTGRFRVTVTATDQAGVRSSASRVVSVVR